MKDKKNIPYYSVERPFDIVYRNNCTSAPVLPHTHNALEIYFTLTDLPDVLLGDTVSGIAAGSLIVIPPHCIHQLFHQREKVYERYIITLSNAWLTAVLSENAHLMQYARPYDAPTILPLTKEEVSALRSGLDHYLRVHDTPTLASYADLFALLSALDQSINTALQKPSSGKLSISKSQKSVNAIIAYINSHLCEQLTLETIAARFYLNKDYLGRLFKKHTHATVGHYISVQRAGLAQNMLAKGHTVAEVQEALGFSSYAYFFKFFKKMTGVSPSQYRRESMSS